MKSVLSFLICLLLVVSFSACTVAEEKFILNESNIISFDLSGITVKGELISGSQNEISFVLSEPENLSGVTFSESKIKTQDVKISYPEIKEESPVYMLICIVKDISLKEIFLPRKGDFTVSGSVPSWNYKIAFDCENQKIISIETEKYKYIFE